MGLKKTRLKGKSTLSLRVLRVSFRAKKAPLENVMKPSLNFEGLAPGLAVLQAAAWARRCFRNRWSTTTAKAKAERSFHEIETVFCTITKNGFDFVKT